MNYPLLLTALFSLAVLCRASSMNSIQKSEFAKGNGIGDKDLIGESFVKPQPIKDARAYHGGDNEEIDGFTIRASFNLTNNGQDTRIAVGRVNFGVLGWAETRAATATTTWPPKKTAVLWETTQMTSTTKAPVGKSNLAKVTIFSHDLNSPYPSYQFSIRRFEKAVNPWRNIPKSDITELASLYLYKKATRLYSMAIRFCSAKDRKNGIKRWSIKRRRCPKGWSEEFTLFGSQVQRKSSQRYTVGNRGKPYWTSRISANLPSKGYTSNHFYFYGPKIGKSQPTRVGPTRPTTTTRRTRRPRTTPWLVTSRPGRTKRPRTTPASTSKGDRPVFPVTQPDQKFSRSVFNENCLKAQNFFRAVHNVPPLKWSNKLARNAQSWANQLKRIAPEGSDEVKLLKLRTKNWPHSDSGSKYRNRGDGENIAWDLSLDGSPAEESVQRFYAEIFYFDRKNPTRAPAPDKPVGHLTQLLWKETTHVGCGIAVSESTFRRKSTWTVIQYSPGGNVYYQNNIKMTNKLYNEQVPDMEKGACMTNSGSCIDGNQCMAFGPSQGTCSCKNESPSCQSAGGCIAWCETEVYRWPWKKECFGLSSCSCGDEGATCQ